MPRHPHARSATLNDEEFVESYASRRRAGRFQAVSPDTPDLASTINAINFAIEQSPTEDVIIPEEHKIPKIIEVNRIRLLTDGVIAVGITLLIVELKVPTELTQDALLNTLYEIMAICAVTMLLIGVWVTHLHVFTVLQGADSIITFFNTILILFVCFVPFTVMVAVNWSTQFYAILLVNIALIMINVMMAAIWMYATYKRRFVFGTDRLASRDIIKTTLRIWFPVAFYCISIAVGAGSRWASIAVTASVVFVFCLSSVGLDIFSFIWWVMDKIKQRRNHTSLESPSEIEENFLLSHEYEEEVIERLKGFADAMFAIVITILVLQLHAPVKEHVLHNLGTHDDEWLLNEELGRALISEELYPVYIAFAVSVILVSNYWKTHCYILSRIHRTDRLFIFANMILLIIVSFIPYAATLLGKFPTHIAPAVVFNGLLVLVGLALLWVFWMANFRNRLARSPAAYKVLANIRIASAPIIYSIAFGIAFANTYASIGVSMLVPVMEVAAALNLDMYRLGWRGLIWIYEKSKKTKVEVAAPAEKHLYRYSIR